MKVKSMKAKSGIFVFGMMIFLVPSLAFANVIINEIAWMGSRVDNVDSSKWQYYEWIELFNNGNDAVNLTGWTLSIVGKKDISLENTIPANGYYFTERSGYHAFDSVIADLPTSFGTGLPNSGATLVLKDAASNPIDTVDGSDNWRIGGGDIIGNNTTKETAQRISSGWITATATPKAVNAGVSQGSQPQSQEPQPQQQLSQFSSSGSDSSSYIPPEKLPKIKVYAGEDKRVTVGATTEFKGQAFGLEDEPLDNARFLWTFGDGASKEGKNITHFYQYPGEYIVVLNVSSGEYFASDSMLVKALPNQIFISEIKTGADSWIELENKSKEEIDISGSQIKYENQIFVFPQSTRIRPSAYLIIPSSVSGMIFYPGKGVVELLYPGGFKADSFSYNGFLQDSQTFNRLDAASPEGSRQGGTYGASLIGLESPAAKNLIPSTEIKTASVSAPKKEESVAAGAKNTSDFSDNSGAGAGVATNTNEAAIIISQDSGSKNIIYLLAAFGVAVFGAIVFLFIRRKRGGEHF